MLFYLGFSRERASGDEKIRQQMLSSTVPADLTHTESLKVGPDDVTLLLGTRDSVPMEHCSTLYQGVASASNNVC